MLKEKLEKLDKFLIARLQAIINFTGLMPLWWAKQVSFLHGLLLLLTAVFSYSEMLENNGVAFWYVALFVNILEAFAIMLLALLGQITRTKRDELQSMRLSTIGSGVLATVLLLPTGGFFVVYTASRVTLALSAYLLALDDPPPPKRQTKPAFQG